MDDQEPAGLDAFLSDSPETAMAEQGFKALAPVAQAIAEKAGQNLDKFGQTAIDAAHGDPEAAKQVAEHSLGAATMGSTTPVFTTEEAGETAYKGLVDKAREMFPDAKSFEDLYKTADARLHSSHPVMRALQQQKDRPMNLKQLHSGKNMADGGSVDAAPPMPEAAPQQQMQQPPAAGTAEPAGLDAFLNEGEPAGLDQYISDVPDQSPHGTPSQQALTALESFGQGVAGPLSSLAETKILGVKPEDIRARQEENPITHGLGEAAGLAGSMLTGVGEGAIAAKAGLKAAQALGDLQAASTIARVGSAATKAAIENMVVQGSDELSKTVLGDPHQSTQTAMSDIGLAGLLGGAFGAAGPLWHATVGDKVGGVLNALSNKFGGIEGITDDAVNEGIQKLGLTVPPELRVAMSNDPQFQQMFQHLQQSGSASGKKAQEALTNFKRSTNETLLSSIGVSPEAVERLPDLSEYEAGQKVIKNLSGELKSMIDPISSDFEKIKSRYKGIEVNNNVRGDIAQKLSDLVTEQGYDLSPSLPQNKIIQNVFEELPNINNLEQARQYSSLIGDRTQSPELQRLGGQIKKIFRQVEDDVVEKHLGVESPELLATHAGARESYKNAMNLIDDLNDRLHVGKYAGPDSFIRALKDMAPEDVVRRLSPKGDASILNTLSKFPAASTSLKEIHLSQVLKKSAEKAEPGELLNLKTFFNHFEKLPPETREFLINPEAQSRVEAIKAISDVLPSKPIYNPHENILGKIGHALPTAATAAGAMLFGHNPIMGGIIGALAHHLGKDVPDAIRLSLLKFLGTGKGVSSEGFLHATTLIQSAIKGESLINRATKNLFSGSKSVLPQYVTVDQKDRDKLNKVLGHYRDNPDDLLKVSGQTDHYAPEMAVSVNEIASRAVNYLNSLRPDQDPKMPLDPRRQASSAQKAAYEQALTIAQQPLSVLSKIKQGTLTGKDLQTLSTLYPDLHKKLQSKVFDQMTDSVHKGQVIPYNTRLGLSVFLGQPLDSTLAPQSIVSAQLVHQVGGPAQNQQNQPQAQKAKHSTAPLSKLSQNYQSQDQAAAARKLARK